MVVEDAAVQGTEATESIVAEHDATRLLVSHHRLGPMHHRHHEKLQGVLAEAQSLTFGHGFLVLDGTIKCFKRCKSFGVAHHLHFGPFPQHGGDATAMVWLVVINDKVIDFAALQHRLDFEKILLDEACLNGVNQGNLFIHNEI